MAKEVDFTKARKRKRRIRRLRKFLVFLVLFAVVAVLYVKKDYWIPKLQGIGSRYINITEGDINGSFPLTISGSSNYQMKFMQNRLFILSEDVLYEYSSSGKLIKSWKHGLKNSSMQVNGKRAVVFEKGSNKFKVYSKNGQVFKDETTGSILFAKLSADGYLAVVTESDTMAGELDIYNPEGKFLYKRDCVDRVLDFSFEKNQTSGVISFFSPNNGVAAYYLTKINFNSKKDVWKSDICDSLLVESFINDKGQIFAVGDTKTTTFTENGKVLNVYNYSASLEGYDFYKNELCLYFNNESTHDMKTAYFASADKMPEEKSYNKNIKSVKIDSSKIYVLDSDGITEYDKNMKKLSDISIDDSYTDFIKYAGYYFLNGKNEINRVNIG